MNPINIYKKTQNTTDSAIQVSVRALRSVLLYCQDWSDNELTLRQRLEAVDAGRQLCDALIIYMRDDLPLRERQLLTTVLQHTSDELAVCMTDVYKSLIDVEYNLMKIIQLFSK
jgi:hypothetical protein